MSHLQDVHAIAERFLRDIESGKISFYAEPRQTVVQPTAEPPVNKVIVMRDSHRPYLVGVKRDGTTVWSKEVQFARAFDSDCLTLMKHLAECKRDGQHVETFPACHFHA